MTEWIECKLSDIGEIVGGATPSTKDEANYDGDIAWLTPKDLSTFSERYIGRGERSITEKGFNSCSTRMLPKNSVLFSSRAPIGYVAIAANEMCTNQGFKSVVPNEKVDYMFLYYLLKYKKDAIEGMGSGTTFKEVSGNVMKSIDVRIPNDLNVQKRIAEILDKIDSKIENNNAINRNLSEQAQALYKSWFIDFEPYGGVMPDDWKQGTLGDVAEIRTDAFRPDKNPDVVVEHYSIPALDEKNYPVFEGASGIKSNKYFVTKNDVMFSKLNPDTKRIWRPYCLSEYPVCSTEFMVYRAYKPEYKDFVFSIIDSVPFLQHVCAHTSGSTNSRQRAIPATTLTFDIVIPTEEVIEGFCNAVTPMYELIEKNVIENQTLAETRDRLLPKLMSGELDVSDLDI